MPEDTARAQRRIEAILRARDVPASDRARLLAWRPRRRWRTSRSAPMVAAAGAIARVEVRLLPEAIQIRFEDTGTGATQRLHGAPEAPGRRVKGGAR